MNSSLMRLLLCCLLMIATPLQGLAAITAGASASCNMSEMAMQSAGDQHGTTGKTPVHCAHCVQDCTCPAFVALFRAPGLALPDHFQEMDFPIWQHSLPSVTQPALERPPRA